MKRLHLSFDVADLDKSIAFYSQLLAAEPTLVRDGYAKWLLDDPRVNLVVQTAENPGFSHVGIQTESEEELHGVFERMKEAEAPYLPEGVTTCCYHKSEKSWTADPDGVMWEAFFTHHQTEERGGGPDFLGADEGAAETTAEALGSGCGGLGCCG